MSDDTRKHQIYNNVINNAYAVAHCVVTYLVREKLRSPQVSNILG